MPSNGQHAMQWNPRRWNGLSSGLAIMLLTVVSCIVYVEVRIVKLLSQSSALYTDERRVLAQLKILQHGNYCVIQNAIKREPSVSDEDEKRITLVLHVSYDEFDGRILEQIDSWDGPISLSVAVVNTNLRKAMEEAKAKIFKYGPLIKNKVSAHLFYPSSGNCSEDDLDQENIVVDPLYPVQAARNIARKMVTTKFVLVFDCEFIFSFNFEGLMRDLAEKELTKNPKEVLVFRIFEVDDSVPKLPRRKHELYDLYKQGKAVQFHHFYAANCHAISGIDEWFNAASSETGTNVSQIVPYTKSGWEPSLVSLNDIPLHDENFAYLSADSVSLRWELCRMNYTFAVVNDLFAVHRGIKRRQSAKNKMLARIALSRAKVAKGLFRERMNRLYPETERTCPKL